MLASHADGYMEVPWCREWLICHLNVVTQTARHFLTWALTSLALYTLLLDGRKPNVTAAYSHALTHALSMWRNLTIWQPMHLLTGWFALLPAEGNHVMYDRTMVLILSARKNELARSFRQLNREKIIQAARRCDIQWEFNPPLASHHGGAWEHMIRTIRCVLYAILHRSPRLSDDVLATVFCEAENIVNSRPLTKCSDNVLDCDPLTPNHLLVLKGNYSFPWTNLKDGNMYQRKWRYVQHFVRLFWSRWTREYLPELHRRQKWQQEMPNVQKGDIVMILDENSPRGSWPIGRVDDVMTGRDGLVRSVRLSTRSTTLVRPITQIVLLEGVNA